jgi:hypothetical protein
MLAAFSEMVMCELPPGMGGGRKNYIPSSKGTFLLEPRLGEPSLV